MDGTCCGQSILGKVTYGKNSVKFVVFLADTLPMVVISIVFNQYVQVIWETNLKCILCECLGKGSVTDGTVLSSHIPTSKTTVSSNIVEF